MKDTLLGGRYLVLDTIAAGGEAQVFRAQDTMTLTEIAARLALHPTTAREISTFPSFHSGWVRLLDSGTDGLHGPYQILELLNGPTLDQLIQAGPLDAGAWRHFIDQSLDAVEALHVLNWVHGDLNADNFIQASDANWKLLELPFLRFAPSPDRSALFGSIHTLAPEQIDGAQPDVRSDLYSLGCLYYYAAAGEFPHPGGTSVQIAVDRLRFAPLPLAEKAPHLPPAWSAWVMTLLERDPQNRFAAVNEARHLLGVA